MVGYSKLQLLVYKGVLVSNIVAKFCLAWIPVCTMELYHRYHI
jgi:hypothetical protein